MPKGERPHPRRSYRRGVNLEDAADNVASFSNVIKSANALPSDRGVHAAERYHQDSRGDSGNGTDDENPGSR